MFSCLINKKGRICPENVIQQPFKSQCQRQFLTEYNGVMVSKGLLPSLIPDCTAAILFNSRKKREEEDRMSREKRQEAIR